LRAVIPSERHCRDEESERFLRSVAAFEMTNGILLFSLYLADLTLNLNRKRLKKRI